MLKFHIFRCKPSRPKGARERNKEICKLIMGLTYDEATRSMFVSNLKAKMTEFNLEVVYLASPPNVRIAKKLESPTRLA